MDKVSLSKLANDYRNAGKIEESIKAFKEYIAVCEKEGDIRGEASGWHMAAIALSLGITSEKDPYFADALTYIEKAVLLYKGDRVMQAVLLRDKGILYTRAGKYVEANDFYIQSIGKFIDIGNYDQEAISHDKLGLLFLIEGQLDEAEREIRIALELLSNTAAWFYKGTAYLDLARVFCKKKSYAYVLKFANKSLQVFLMHYADEPHPRRLAEIYMLMQIANTELANTYLSKLDTVARGVVEQDIQALQK